ncbi:NADH-quinone oxidoreductase subunit NuoE [Cellulomonas cellasea]|uniref:NADH-quinone oxidoreductase subunit E n=1 Tax=Cellulomonas cellasea TaxID=43670 RepID=A0A7W4UEA9_9CELL|nr:NADH-quinone oxidoreductase subunit NuoE [Cellulomonas cellasea]MBB2922472.1 NADH-quinone oxidoreductase subunit E [Cellulomonas cellasea]
MSVENSTHAPVGAGRVAAYDGATFARLAADAEQIIARYPQARSALLPMLHLVQSEDGYVSPAGIAFCGQMLSLTTAEVSAVATFYSQYKRRPNGEYTVGVCTNTLCAVMGGDAIWEELAEHLEVGHDETTPDGKVTLERIECNAACDYAPVVMVNWEFFDNQTPESAVETVDRLRAGEPVAPTRGASSVCSFKAMSRVLAGFPDGRADEGVGAGEATVRGTRLARAHGWTAPAFPGEGGAGTDGAGTDGTTGKQPDATPGTAEPEPKPRAKRPAGTTPRTRTAAGAPATRTAPEAAKAAGTPEVGAEQSSAQRSPEGPADSSTAAQDKKQQSEQAKES